MEKTKCGSEGDRDASWNQSLLLRVDAVSGEVQGDDDVDGNLGYDSTRGEDRSTCQGSCVPYRMRLGEANGDFEATVGESLDE